MKSDKMKKAIHFIVLTCLVSWIAAGAAILLGLHEAKGLIYTVFAMVYMLFPAICAIILQKIHKEKLFSNLGISFRFNRWFLVAGAVPILYAFMALGVNLLFPNVSFSANYEGLLAILPDDQAALAAEQLSKIPPAVFLLIQLVQAIIAGCTINAFFAFGEELGWRGYLLKALQDKNFLSVSLITGFVWGLWHFPLILIGHNYPQHPVAGVGMMIIWCILLSPVMTYIVIKSKSVITAAIFHGTLNAIAGISILYIVGGNDLTNGVTGFAGMTALLLVNFAFYLYDKYVTKENIFTKAIGDY
jgi:membrane protease YdiL (CAAX protease family)